MLKPTPQTLRRQLQRSQHGPSPTAPERKPEALFHSVRSALAFAYAIVHFPIASSPKLGPSVGASGRMASLSPHEKHAQGALIRKIAEQRLQGIEVAVTFAFYGSGEVRTAAIREVGKVVAQLVRKEGLGVELAKRNFSRNGIRKTQDELAKEFGLGLRQIQRLDKLVGEEIDRLRLLTEERLEAYFVTSGISEGV